MALIDPTITATEIEYVTVRANNAPEMQLRLNEAAEALDTDQSITDIELVSTGAAPNFLAVLTVSNGSGSTPSVPSSNATFFAVDGIDPVPMMASLAAAIRNLTGQVVAKMVSAGAGAGPHYMAIGLASPQLEIIVDTFLAGQTQFAPMFSSVGTVEGWAGGGGGVAGAGAGGAGEYVRLDNYEFDGALVYDMEIGVGGVGGADGTNTTWQTSELVATAGLGRTNGGTGGTGGVGDVTRDGGDGATGSGTRLGGAASGRDTAAVGATPGAPDGGRCKAGPLGQDMPGAGGTSDDGDGNGGKDGALRVTYRRPKLAGFAWPVGTEWGRDTANALTRNVTIPAGKTGDTLICIVASDGSPTITMPGWTAIVQATSGASPTLAVFARAATGSDPVAVDTDASEQTNWHVRRFSGGDTANIDGTTATGSGPDADPPNHVPAGGVDSYVWLACAAWDNNGSFALTSAPAGYEGQIFAAGALTNQGCAIASCFIRSTSASQDPGPWGSATEQWVAATVSIPVA